MNKAHENIGWQNEPSDATPINEYNLNKMDRSIDLIDDRVISLDTTKFDVVEANLLVKNITFNRANGVFTIKYYNNTTATIDTMLEKIMVNFTYDPQSQRLIITLDDGTKQYVDLSALITQYEFLDSDTISFTLNADGKVSANVKEGSIQEKHLRPDYLADVRLEVSKAQSSASSAKVSEVNAKASEQAAKESEDNAAGFSGSASASATEATEKAAAAAGSASAAKTSEENAKSSEDKAKESENNAKSSEENAESSKTEAAGSAAAAGREAEDASNHAEMSKSYAVGGTGTRPGEDTDNAKYYYEQVKDSASGAGALMLKGKIPFSQIPSTGNKRGDMYDINEKFVTDSRFLEGPGYFYPAGTNIYWTEEGKWDCLSGAEKMELTQAQYDSLSNEEKTNGTVYYITDADDSIPPASSEQAGLMQPVDKEKLDGIEPGATRVVVDGELSATSENPVQNKIIKTALDSKANTASPTFTGTPKAPTASSGTNNTQIATTAFVNNAVSNHNASSVSHSDIRSLITGLTTRLNALADSDDTTLDQLSEIVAYIKANRSLIESVTTTKVNVSDIVDNLTSVARNKPLSAKQGKVLKDLITGLENAMPEASTAAPKSPGTASAGASQAYSRGDHIHPAQTSVTGNAGTATKLSNARNINGMLFDGSANRVNYGVCNTAAATAAKTVACTGFSLTTGAEITVKFTYTNTALNPTLNVNGTGAKPIFACGAAPQPGYITPWRTHTLRYNGIQWEITGAFDDYIAFEQTTTVRYFGFVLMQKPSAVGSGSSQFSALVSGVGSFGDNYFGTYLVTCSTRGGVKMSVMALETGNGGEFGWWDSGDGVMFGIKTATYNYKLCVKRLSGDLPGILYDSTTQPAGWTPVSTKKIVSGIKGDKETAYRNGDVNLTADNIGALPLAGGTMSGNIKMQGWAVDYSGGSTHLSGAQGSAALRGMGAPGEHCMLLRGKSLNGYFLDGTYGKERIIEYMSQERVDGQVNAPNYSLALLDEEGNSYFPGNVKMNNLILRNPVNINETPFDGTKDIELKEYRNFSFPLNLGEERYRGLCSLYNVKTVRGNPSELTLLVSGAGRYNTGDRRSGVYLIHCHTMGEIVMDVLELMPPGSGGKIEFGYWANGDKIVFGMHHDIWNYEINVMKIHETYGYKWEPTVENLYDSAVKPEGWTEVGQNTVEKKEYCIVGSDESNSSGWYKFASITIANTIDENILFSIMNTYASGQSGIFTAQLRGGTNTVSKSRFGWLSRSGFKEDSVIASVSGNMVSLYVKLEQSQYGRIAVEIISNFKHNGIGSGISLVSSNSPTAGVTATYTSEDIMAGVFKEHVNNYADADYINNFRTDLGADISDSFLGIYRTNASGVPYLRAYQAAFAFGAYGGTHALLSVHHQDPEAYIGGGSDNKLNWVERLAFAKDVPKIRQLTQAQYNALSESEKMNNTVYFITDAN